MSTITTGSGPRLLQAGLKNIFGNTLKQHPNLNEMMYKMGKSTKAYEVDLQWEGLGLAPVKNEGADLAYDSMSQGFVPKYVHLTYAKGIVATKEMLQDEQYGVLGRRTEALARSVVQTRNTTGAAVLNNGFDTAYVMSGGDGKPLFSASHVNGPHGGTYSNLAGTPSDLTEATLEDMLVQIKGATDARGLTVALNGRKLVVPNNYAFIAQRILKSQLQSDTANNAINAIASTNSLPEGFMVNPFLTDTDAFFVLTDADYGLQCMVRQEPEFAEDSDFNSSNRRFKVDYRESYGWSDPRGVYGNAG